MKNGKESLRIHIAVDSTKVYRCKWCGSVESAEWRHRQTGLYCSGDCQSAEQANMFIASYFFEVFAANLLLTVIDKKYIVAFFITSILLFSPFLYWGLIGLKRKKIIAKDSRRNDTPLDTALLKSISSAVFCPRCNAKIDVRKASEDRIFNCEYCGASGTIEVVKTS